MGIARITKYQSNSTQAAGHLGRLSRGNRSKTTARLKENAIGYYKLIR